MHEHHVTHEGGRGGWTEKASFYILLVISSLIPIFFVPAAFVSTQFGTSLLFAYGTIVSIILYIIRAMMSGSLDLPRPVKYMLGFTALVPIAYTLAGIANGFSRMSFFGYTFDIGTVGFIVLGFIYVFLVSMYFKTKTRVFYGYFGFFIASIVLALFLLIRIIFGADVLDFGIFSTLTSSMVGSWNNVGILFGAGAILSLLTYEMAKVSTFIKVILTIALVVSLFFLALVNFGTIWVIVGLTAFLFILYGLFNNGHMGSTSFGEKVKSIPVYPSIVLVISIIFVMWGSSLGSFLSRSLEVSNVEVRPTLAVTLEIARNTLSQRPLFGSGPNTFTTQWLAWKPADIVSTAFWNTDFANGIGLIPTFAVTTGLLGVLAWFLFLGYYVYLGVKSIFARIEDAFVKYLVTSSFFVSLYLWIMTFVYMPSTVIFVLTLFFTGLFFASVYVGGVVQVNRYVFSQSPKAGFVSSLLLVSVFVASVGLGFGLWKNSKSLWYFQKSSYALSESQDIPTSEKYMNKAILTVPHDIYYRALSEIEIIKINSILSQDPKTVKPEDAQKQFNEALTAAVTAGILAKDADSSNYLNWIAVGRVYEAVSIPELKVDGAYESAQFAYNEALKRNPQNPGILVLFSRLAMVKKDLATARTYAQRAIEAKKNYIDAYFLLSQIEVADNKVDEAIKSVTAASVIDPTDPGIFFQLGLLKYNNDDYAAAVVDFEKAITMLPNYANAQYFLGLAYDALGQTEKAIAEFEKLKVSNPESTEVVTILANLKAGKPALEGLENENPESGDNLPIEE